MGVAALADDQAPTAEPRCVLVGLVGRGIQQSRTPAMHEAEGLARGLAYIYRLLDNDRMGNGRISLADVVEFAGFFGFDGLNVTFPYKQDILPLLDGLSPEAELLGSVNTVVLRDGRRVGHNTDLWGFEEAFRHAMAGAPRGSVLLLGAGGAGAAVAHALLRGGTRRLMIRDTNGQRAERLAERLAAHFAGGVAEVAGDMRWAAAQADGIVNATPVGMIKVPGMPIEPALLRPECWVADIVYFPLETQLLAEARRRGCRTMSGDGMAVYQAARAFELFTGIPPSIDRMRAAFIASGRSPGQEHLALA
jgi:shikimate dehydrogenase